MAPKRRASSMTGMKKKLARAATVTAKCAVISRALRTAESVPDVVCSMLAKTLHEAFGTYKEDRHPHQVQVTKMVGEALAEEEKSLQKAVDDAKAKKAGLEAEHASGLGASNEAKASAAAAAAAADAKKAALAESKEAIKNAKTTLETAKETLKKAEADVSSPTEKKAQAESLIKEIIPALKGGTAEKAVIKQRVSDAKYLAKTFELDDHFVGFLVSALSKPSSWTTFDKLIVNKFEEDLGTIIAKLDADLAVAEPVKATRIKDLEDAIAAVAAAGEALRKATEDATGAGAAASEAATAAKAAAATAKPEIALIDKAEKACSDAEAVLAAFKSGALVAYAEVLEYAKPLEPAVPVPEVEAVPAAPPIA